MEFPWEAPLSGAEELTALLEDSGVVYERTGDRFRFLFSSQGCKWQTVCDCAGDRVLIYGIHPVPVADRAADLEAADALNRQAVEGGCFVAEGRLVFRTGARLLEPVAARETLARALEYNAAVMTAFWSRLAEGAEGPRKSCP